MTKRVAVCISGQARSFVKGYEYLTKNLLTQPGLDVDVYIHTWTFPKVGEMLNLYRPKSALIEEQIQFDVSKYTNIPPPSPNWSVKNPAFGTVSQLNSIFKANDLSKQYTYDWVVRTRFDFALNDVIPFDQLDNNKLYAPNCRMTPDRDFCNDQFAFSSQTNMGIYSETFWRKDVYYDSGVMMIGEEMLSANLKNYNLIGENLVYCDMKHPFPPGDHNGTFHSLIRDDVNDWSR